MMRIGVVPHSVVMRWGGGGGSSDCNYMELRVDIALASAEVVKGSQ